MTVIKATVHSAISIVNAIATGKGATLGISKDVSVEIETSHGKGITVEIGKRQVNSRLINRVIEKTISKQKDILIKLLIRQISQTKANLNYLSFLILANSNKLIVPKRVIGKRLH